jgi:predicted phosphodiesterase
VIVAVFSDVHANILALEAFLSDVKPVADSYLCLGDTVNYGPWNDECLERVLSLPGITMLEGNHERLFLHEHEVEREIPLVQSFYWHSRTSFSRADLITGLPQAAELGSFRCVHTIDGLRVFPDTDIAVDRDYLIGHSHHQYRIERSGQAIVNPGSVGQNRKRIDQVDYALYETETGAFDFKSVQYDFPGFLAEVKARKYPRTCIEYYERKWAQALAS